MTMPPSSSLHEQRRKAWVEAAALRRRVYELEEAMRKLTEANDRLSEQAAALRQALAAMRTVAARRP